ncbi:MAG: hypothetical protein HYW70_02475 [Candidatus Nealsonbacteria bacterium]|nr:hypothetical protein [Candidatus Nealsonbacteria bacterium]
MIELFFKFIFIGSLAGMGAILMRKMPFLVRLSPAKIPSSRDFTKILKSLTAKFLNIPQLKDISLVNFLEKILLRLRIFTLKAENQTTTLIQKLKEKSQKEGASKDSYWDELKKAKDGK